MTVDELVKIMRAEPPLAVPAKLAQHVPFVLANLEILLARLQVQSDASPSIRVAMFWTMALIATHGTVVEGLPHDPRLTPFGEALLQQVALNLLGVRGEEQPHVQGRAPTDEELRQIDAALWEQTIYEKPQGFHAILLAYLTQATIALAPPELIEARETLAATALVLAELLSDMAALDQDDGITAAVQGLLAAAASCIPPDQFTFARRQAARVYWSIQEANADLTEEEPDEMTVEDFVQAILSIELTAVPALLADQIAFIIEHAELHSLLLDESPNFYEQAVDHEGPSDPATVAVYWLEACVTLDGAFWKPESTKPLLTTFGAAVLSSISLAGPSAFDRKLTLPEGIVPRANDLDRLDSIIQRQMEGKASNLASLYILSRAMRLALAAADRVEQGRQLAGRVSNLAQLMLTLSARRGMMQEVQADLRREATALQQVVAEFDQALVDHARQSVDDVRRPAEPSPTPNLELVERLLAESKELIQQSRYAEANVPLQEVIPLLEELAQGNPVYQAKLSSALLLFAMSLQPFALFEQLGNLDQIGQVAEALHHPSTEALEEALTAMEQALDLYQTLAITDDAQYGPKYALCLGWIGMIKLQLNEGEALTLVDNAIELLEGYAQHDQEVESVLNRVRYLRILADQVPAILQLITRETAGDEAFLEGARLRASIDDLRVLVASEPSLLPRLAEALALYGAMLQQEERSAEALEALSEASAIYRRLVDEDSDLIPLWASTQALMGDLLVRLNQGEEARVAVTEVIEWCRQLSSEELARERQVSLVIALTTAGQVVNDLGDSQAALAPLTDAIAIARQIATEDPQYEAHLAQTLVTLGIVLHALERETEMIHLFEEADQRGIPIFSEWFTNKRPSWDLLARLYLALGDPAYLQRAIQAAAGHEAPIQDLLMCLQQEAPDVGDRLKVAAELSLKLWQNGRQGEALTLELVTRFFSTRLMQVIDEWAPGRRTDALEVIELNTSRMLAICEALHDEPCRAQVLFYHSAAMGLALQGSTLHALQGIAPRAIQDMAAAADIYRSLAKRDPVYRGPLVTVLSNLGLIYSNQEDPGRVEEGTALLEEATAHSRVLAQEYPTAEQELVMILNNLGIAYGALGYARTPARLQELQHDRDVNRFFVKLDPRMAALKAFEVLGEALNRAGELLDKEEWATVAYTEVLGNMAAIATLADDQTTGLKFVNAALDRYRTLTTGQKHLGTRLLEIGIRLFFVRGILLPHESDAQACEQLTACYAALNQATELAETYLSDLPWQDPQLRFIGNEDGLHKQLVRTCLLGTSIAETEAERQDWLEKAWRHTDHARARLTLQTLIQAAADAPPAASASTRSFQDYAARARQYGDLIHQRSVLSGMDAAQYRAKQDKLDQERKQLRRDLDPIKELSPAEQPDLGRVQQHLRSIPDGALLVEFYSLPTSLVLFILDGSTLSVEEVALSAEQLHILTRSFKPADHDRPREEQLSQALDVLGSYLMPILAPLLAPLPASPMATPDRVPHIFLLPSGDLHFWPLHALPLGDGTRLLDHYSVSLLPAAVALPMLANQKARPGPYYGFAPATDLEYALPQIYIEAAILSDSLKAEVILKEGVAATFDGLRDIQGGVLSLATHAQVDLDAPEHSVVQLAAPQNDTDDPASSLQWVTALEFLVGLHDLHCELLLLWGCKAHGEGAQVGDNWLGISRAFLGAARSLVSSLWSVGDLPTLVVSIECMRGLAQGLTVPQALRKAVRAIWRADSAQMEEWRALIEKMLPSGKTQQKFVVEWQKLQVREHLLKQSPFAELATWAPYVTIGWPSILQQRTSGDTQTVEAAR